MTRNRSGFVYVFLRTDGLRKLGWTVNLTRRRFKLSNVSGVVHSDEASWKMGDRSAFRVEQAAHVSLRAHHVPFSKEVYPLTLAAISAAVEAAIARVGTDLYFPDGWRQGSRVEMAPIIDTGLIWAEADAAFRANPEAFEEMMSYFAEVSQRLELGETNNAT